MTARQGRMSVDQTYGELPMQLLNSIQKHGSEKSTGTGQSEVTRDLSVSYPFSAKMQTRFSARMVDGIDSDYAREKALGFGFLECFRNKASTHLIPIRRVKRRERQNVKSAASGFGYCMCSI